MMSRAFASEDAVIVVSILLAFWIDASWDNRQARVTEATVLESVLGSTPDALRSLPGDSVAPWLSAMVVTWTYDGDDSAAGLFLGSSAPVTQHAREVRIVLARRVRILDDMEEEKATVWELGSDVANRLASYATTAADDGQGLLYQVAGRLGPVLRAQLRQDDEFVAAALNKDSLRALVREGADTPS